MCCKKIFVIYCNTWMYEAHLVYEGILVKHVLTGITHASKYVCAQILSASDLCKYDTALST